MLLDEALTRLWRVTIFMKASYKTALLYGAVALISMVAGVLAAQWLQGDKSTPIQTERQVGIPEIRPDFSLNSLEGDRRSLSEWDGNIILLNFWATWCPPCRKEMPDFIELREQLEGEPLEIIDVAIDQAEPVQDFVDEIGVEYPILLAELEGLTIMREYGNQLTTLPYTAVIDRNQRIIKTFRTEVTKEDVLEAIQPLLSDSVVVAR